MGVSRNMAAQAVFRRLARHAAVTVLRLLRYYGTDDWAPGALFAFGVLIRDRVMNRLALGD